jgi:hypothetical protein
MLLNIPKEHEAAVSKIMGMLTETKAKDVRGICFVLLADDEHGYRFVFNKMKATDLYAIAGYISHKAGEQLYEEKYPDVFIETNESEMD